MSDPKIPGHEEAFEAFREASFDEGSYNQEAVEQTGRLVRHNLYREKFSYWSPMLIGAGVTIVALLTLLQILTQPSSAPLEISSQKAELSQSPQNTLPKFDESGQ